MKKIFISGVVIFSLFALTTAVFAAAKPPRGKKDPRKEKTEIREDRPDRPDRVGLPPDEPDPFVPELIV